MTDELTAVRAASTATAQAQHTLHQAVRAALAAGCTITAVAAAADVTRQTIYRWTSTTT